MLPAVYNSTFYRHFRTVSFHTLITFPTTYYTCWRTTVAGLFSIVNRCNGACLHAEKECVIEWRVKNKKAKHFEVYDAVLVRTSGKYMLIWLSVILCHGCIVNFCHCWIRDLPKFNFGFSTDSIPPWSFIVLLLFRNFGVLDFPFR